MYQCLGNDYSEQEDRFMVKSMMVVMADQDMMLSELI